MTFGEKLKTIRLERDMSQDELALLLGTSKQVISRYETGQRTPKITVAQEYANILKLPLEYLINDEINSLSQYSPALTHKDERDIVRELERMRERLMTEEGLMFDGAPASREAIESILDAMEIGMTLAKKKNKERFTPKQYRKDKP